MNEKDENMLNWLKLFNKYDLYTKTDKFVVEDKTLEYYNNLIKLYFKNEELLI